MKNRADIEKNFHIGCEDLDQKDFVSAIINFEKVTNDDPSNSEAFLKKANSYFGLMKYNNALVDYSRTIELNPNQATAFINRGNTHVMLENFGDAVADYTHALILEPNGILANFNRAILYQKLNKQSEAISDYSVWIKNKTNDPAGFYGRGKTFFDLGNFPEAISDLSKAMEKGMNDPEIYNLRGRAYDLIGNTSLAKADFLKEKSLIGVQLNPIADKGTIFQFTSTWKIFFAVFLSVSLAIFLAIFCFFPDQLPPGIGFESPPVSIFTRNSLIGEEKVLFITNKSGKTLKNLKIHIVSKKNSTEKSFFKETLEPEGFFEIGWIQGWKLETGNEISISCSGYLKGSMIYN